MWTVDLLKEKFDYLSSIYSDDFLEKMCNLLNDRPEDYYLKECEVCGHINFGNFCICGFCGKDPEDHRIRVGKLKRDYKRTIKKDPTYTWMRKNNLTF